MSFLNITKVSDTGEQCWGVVLFDADGMPILRSEKGVTKVEALAIAKILKFEGPEAVAVEEKVGEAGGLGWVIEKTDRGWTVRLTRVVATAFDLLLKLEDAEQIQKVTEEVMEVVKGCLARVEIKWDPPEADPAYDEKETDETEIEGLPGS